MSLRFIYGRAGSGKSYFCFNDIKRKIEEGGSEQLILLVPEDFSFQAEKELLRVVGEESIIKAKVLSFKRLAYSVFKEVGGLTRRHMNGAGRSMLLYKIMDEIKDELKVFSKAVRMQGFVNTMSEIITELKTYEIGPDSLLEACSRIEDLSLKGKVEDISLIYSKFEDALHLGYIDTDDDLTILSNKLEKYNIFDGSEIWVDGFSVFTPQQYRVLERLLRKASRVNITLCTDRPGERTRYGNVDVFSCIRSIEERILKIASDNNISYEKPVVINDIPCFKFKGHKELHHLERNIYSFPSGTYEDKTEHISLFKALNRYSEVEDTARDIIRLCRDLNFRFADIAVVTRDMDSYEKLVPPIFNEYGIPYFLDKKRDINGNPLTVLILSAIEILSKNWQYEHVFSYLKTGLLNICDEDIDILENYVLSAGIKGKRWMDTWKYWPDYGYDGELPEDAVEKLKRINEIRVTVSAPLIAFGENVKKNKNALGIAGALFELMESLKVYERIDSLIREFREMGQHDLANEYSKVWNMVMEILDQAVEVLGSQDMSLEQFARVLSIGLDGCKVGLIPPTLDQVMFGSVERIKSHSVKALYILGVNDGLFPAVPSEEGVINDVDRENLKSLGLELAPSTRDRVYDEQFLVYTAFTRTENYLRISYPVADHEGKTLRPSMVLSSLKKIFGNITEYSNVLPVDTIEENLRCINNPVSTFNGLVRSMRKVADGALVNPIWSDVQNWYANSQGWRNMVNSVIEGINYKNQVNRIDDTRIKSLYGKNPRLSISRLEKYAGCPFSYFLQYGLRARERKVWEFSAPDLGSFMHSILDNFSKYMDDSGKRWRDLEKDECRNIVSQIVDSTVEKMTGSILSSSARYRHIKERLKRIMLRAVWLITQHIKHGGFEPVGHEVVFESHGKYKPISLRLPTGENISLGGRIDRVDTYEDEEAIYVRIVDYKSGNKKFSLSDIYNGLEFQLLIYLDAILEEMSKTSKKPVYPGGILYFKIDDPIISTGSELSEEEVEREIMKLLKMNGLVLSDVKVVKEMDRELKGYSIYIPVMVKNDGTFGSNSSVASKEEFEAMRKHVKNKIIGLCSEMLKGNINISPYNNEGFTPCGYCSFKSVCRFDIGLKENNYRRVYSYKNDEVWSAIKQEIAVGGGESYGLD